MGLEFRDYASEIFQHFGLANNLTHFIFILNLQRRRIRWRIIDTLKYSIGKIYSLLFKAKIFYQRILWKLYIQVNRFARVIRGDGYPKAVMSDVVEEDEIVLAYELHLEGLEEAEGMGEDWHFACFSDIEEGFYVIFDQLFLD